MELEDLAQNWDALGREQPITAVVSSLQAGDEHAFFQSGRLEVTALLEAIGELGYVPSGPVLDFGCGMGRLTQGLAERYDDVTGVDIAPSMIELANAANQFPERCSYVLNCRDDLVTLGEKRFGLVVSYIVLQHVGPDLIRRYIPELVRMLQPGGILAFQLPSHLKPLLPLAPGAHRASITVLNQSEANNSNQKALNSDRTLDTIVAMPGESIELAVEVENISEMTWKRDHLVSLGRRWLDANSGALLVHADDGSRVPISSDMPPGAQVHLDIDVRVPSSAGQYLLELDLSQPGAPLFADQGSTRLFLAVQVSEIEPELTGHFHTAPDQGKSPLPVVAHLEMHGLVRAEVEALLTCSGAQIITVLDDYSAGPEWTSYRYIATTA